MTVAAPARRQGALARAARTTALAAAALMLIPMSAVAPAEAAPLGSAGEGAPAISTADPTAEPTTPATTEPTKADSAVASDEGTAADSTAPATTAPKQSGSALSARSSKPSSKSVGGAAIDRRWRKLGGAKGKLGPAVTGTRCGLKGGGCYKAFRNGSIHWSPKSGAHPTWGAFRSMWWKQGSERGSWGYPRGEERRRADGRYEQRFEGGWKVRGRVNDTAKRNAIIATAKKGVGVRYRSGGTSPRTGWDCSGFVHYVYKQNGVSLPRASRGQRSAGKRVSAAQAKPGDIIYIPGHVGIVSETKGQMYDAGNVRTKTSKRSYSWMTKRGAVFIRVL